MTEKEYLSFFEWWIGGFKFKEPTLTPQSPLVHDIWSAYLYGETVKFVYIKSAPNRRKDGEKPKRFATPPEDEDKRFSQSISRSKARVFELASCNEFKYFCTFTQNKELRDRFDITKFRKDFAQYVRNLNRGRAEEDKIKYLLIPEQHKDGAWHLHGLLMGLTNKELTPFKMSDKIPLKIKKQIKSGEIVYNWRNYMQKFGFFTCTEIKEKGACCRYVTKYISKDFQSGVRKAGEHLFFASQGLKGRDTFVKNSADKCPIEQWDYENDYIKVKEMPLSQILDSNGELTFFGKDSE